MVAINKSPIFSHMTSYWDRIASFYPITTDLRTGPPSPTGRSFPDEDY
jgi:hypothetical protein